MKTKLTILTTLLLAVLCTGFAANVQIKDLTETTSLNSGDLVQVEQLIGGVYHDRKITFGNLQLSISIAGSQVTGAYTASNLTLSTGKLLGRASSGSGKAEELAADSTLTISSGTFGVNNATIAPVWSNITGTPTTFAGYGLSDTSANLRATLTDETGTGAAVFANSPTLITPALGTPSAITLTNATGLPVSTGISGLGSGVATFLATPSSANLAGAITDETGTGAAVFANSPTLITPSLGTPSAITLTNATGLPVATGIIGLGSGVATFLATPSSANLATAITDETGTGATVFANSPTLITPALGTPSAITLTNATGLPVSTGISGLGSGVATFLATPTSANLAAAITNETGSGLAVFGTSPNITTPTGIVKGDVGLGNVDNTSDATKNAAAVTLANHTLNSSNVISPSAVMMPQAIAVVSASLASAGDQYWPAGFVGVSQGLTPNGDGFDSYHIVFSYTGGSPQPYEVANGVKPLTSWPEQYIALAGASTRLYNFSYAGGLLSDNLATYFQSMRRVAPINTGMPCALVVDLGDNDFASTDTAATVWTNIQAYIAQCRADGFGPIVLATFAPATNAAEGSTYDSRRLTLNASITGSGTTVADGILDVNTVPGLQATFTPAPMSGGSYTHNSTYYYDNIHWTAAGNGLFAAALLALEKTLAGNVASRTQTTPVGYPAFSYTHQSPFARKRFSLAENVGSNSGGDVYTGAYLAGIINIRNGAANTNYSKTFWYNVPPGAPTGYNGGTLSNRTPSFIDWGRNQTLEFSFYPESGGSGHNWPNTVWLASIGHTPATHGPFDASETGMGLVIDLSTVGQMVLKVVTANGSVTTTSSAVATFSDAAGYGQVNVQLKDNGCGDIDVTINGVTTTLLESVIHGPKASFSNTTFVSYEAYTTGTESNNTYIDFSAPEVSSW